MLFILATHNA